MKAKEEQARIKAELAERFTQCADENFEILISRTLMNSPKPLETYLPEEVKESLKQWEAAIPPLLSPPIRIKDVFYPLRDLCNTQETQLEGQLRGFFCDEQGFLQAWVKEILLTLKDGQTICFFDLLLKKLSHESTEAYDEEGNPYTDEEGKPYIYGSIEKQWAKEQELDLKENDINFIQRCAQGVAALTAEEKEALKERTIASLFIQASYLDTCKGSLVTKYVANSQDEKSNLIVNKVVDDQTLLRNSAPEQLIENCYLAVYPKCYQRAKAEQQEMREIESYQLQQQQKTAGAMQDLLRNTLRGSMPFSNAKKISDKIALILSQPNSDHNALELNQKRMQEIYELAFEGATSQAGSRVKQTLFGRNTNDGQLYLQLQALTAPFLPPVEVKDFVLIEREQAGNSSTPGLGSKSS